MTYDPHELSLAYPPMEKAPYLRLSEDIKRNGLLHPIVLFEGRILDGRHRYRACMEHGIEPSFREFRECDESEACKGDPVAFVHSENAARRHLSESQIAFAMTHPSVLEFERRRAAERQGKRNDLKGFTSASPEAEVESSTPEKGNVIPSASCEADGEAGKTSERLAAKSGVGRATIERSIKVRSDGIPELHQAIQSGEVTVALGEKIAKLNPEAQKRVIEAPSPQLRKHELQVALNRSQSKRREQVKPELPPEPDDDDGAPDEAEMAEVQADLDAQRHALEVLLSADDKLEAARKEIAMLAARLSVVERARNGYQNEAAEWKRRYLREKRDREKLERKIAELSA